MGEAVEQSIGGYDLGRAKYDDHDPHAAHAGRMLKATAALTLFIAISCAPTAAVAPTASPATTTAAPPSSTPTATIDPTACRSAQLSGTFEANGAAAGSAGMSFHLSVATGTCVTAANPVVQLRDVNGATVLTTTSPAGPSPQTVSSATGKDSAFLSFQWSLHGTEPGYRCATMGPLIASVAVPLTASDVLSLTIPASQRSAFCADPPERISASVTGSRVP